MTAHPILGWVGPWEDSRVVLALSWQRWPQADPSPALFLLFQIEKIMSSIGEGIDFSQEQQKISGTLLDKRGKGFTAQCRSLRSSVWTPSEWPTPELRPHWPAFPTWLWHQLVMKIRSLRALFTTLAVWG